MKKDSWLIDPIKITNFKATDFELELMILFWVAAAGKNGVTAAQCLRNMLVHWAERIIGSFPHPGCETFTPFDVIRFMCDEGVGLADEMKKFGIGCYRSKSTAFLQLAFSQMNLRVCSLDALENIHGIGPKTARCFLIHSRPRMKLAGLDTHILKYMRDQGFEVPKSTPSGKKYREIEKQFIGLAKKAKKSIAAFDLAIWNNYRNKKHV